MKRDEFEKLRLYDSLSLTELFGRGKTLLYGYTTDRATFHVYVQSGRLNRLIYHMGESYGHLHIDVWAIIDGVVKPNWDSFVPDKRLYPQKCDFDFCMFLQAHGVRLPFTTWQDLPVGERVPEYWGRVIT